MNMSDHATVTVNVHEAHEQAMSPEFRKVVESLHAKFKILNGAHTTGTPLPRRGVYSFRQNGKALYVGRANNIPARYPDHTTAAVEKAAFASTLPRYNPE